MKESDLMVATMYNAVATKLKGKGDRFTPPKKKRKKKKK